MLSPKLVGQFILNNEILDISCKFFDEVPSVERAIISLLEKQVLILVGQPYILSFCKTVRMTLNESNFIQIIWYLCVPENLIYSIVFIKYKKLFENN